MTKFKVGDYVEVSNPENPMRIFKGRKGKIVSIRDGESEHGGEKLHDIETKENGLISSLFEDELTLVNEPQQTQEMGKFQQIANEAGAFTDMKNKQYGSSVDAAYEMMKILMERYTYDEDNYLMPKSLLQHLLLQVRMMDKQNRIFNNPSGKGDSESPYKDLLGYSLIGVDMVERLKSDTK